MVMKENVMNEYKKSMKREWWMEWWKFDGIFSLDDHFFPQSWPILLSFLVWNLLALSKGTVHPPGHPWDERYICPKKTPNNQFLLVVSTGWFQIITSKMGCLGYQAYMTWLIFIGFVHVGNTSFDGIYAYGSSAARLMLGVQPNHRLLWGWVLCGACGGWELPHPRIAWKNRVSSRVNLGGGFKYFLFSPRKLGEISNLTNIFQTGWNHQLGIALRNDNYIPWKSNWSLATIF